jgi:Flp pilus assembly protein protease CpaA
MDAFFPNLGFAWIYLGMLFTLLVIASGTDLRQYVIPKWISLAALALGVIGNIVRGAWLGGEGRPVWMLSDNGAFVGALDGLLFAGAGFLVGFALFFLMWILGVCGGGDVKLFAALGACVGAYNAILVLIVTLPLIFLFGMVQMMITIAQGNWGKIRASATAIAGKTGVKPKRRVLGFSLPLTIATALVVLWVFRN